MSEFIRRIKKLEKNSGGDGPRFEILFHDDDGVLRNHGGEVHLHVAGDLFQNQVTDEIVMCTIFSHESIRDRI